MVPEIGVVAELVGHGGLGAVTREEDGVGRKGCGERGKTLLHGRPTALGEVCAPDAHAEKCVASEGGMFLGTVEDTGALGVAGSVDDLQGEVAHTDSITMVESSTDGNLFLGELYATEGSHLFREMFHELPVLSKEFDLQGIFAEDGSIAEVMVEMTVSGKEVDRLQLLFMDVVEQGLLLLGVVGATVDDGTLFGGSIGEDVTVGLEGIKSKRLYHRFFILTRST